MNIKYELEDQLEFNKQLLVALRDKVVIKKIIQAIKPFSINEIENKKIKTSKLYKIDIKLKDEKEKLEKLIEEKNKELENIMLENKTVLNKLKNLQYKFHEKVDEVGILNKKIDDINFSLIKSAEKCEDSLLEIKILSEEKCKYLKELDVYKNKYHEIDEIYNTFKSLSNDTLKELEIGIFKGETLDSFIACGVQNVETIWEYIRDSYFNANVSDTEALKKIFRYFLKLYNRNYKVDLLQIEHPIIGSEYNVDKHMKTSDSKSSGIIKEVLLEGYINIRTNKIVKKSIVKL